LIGIIIDPDFTGKMLILAKYVDNKLDDFYRETQTVVLSKHIKYLM
jgi:hypothetical protein